MIESNAMMHDARGQAPVIIISTNYMRNQNRTKPPSLPCLLYLMIVQKSSQVLTPTTTTTHEFRHISFKCCITWNQHHLGPPMATPIRLDQAKCAVRRNCERNYVCFVFVKKVYCVYTYLSLQQQGNLTTSFPKILNFLTE